MIIIPWKVDVPQEQLPLANWLIIGIIIGFFVWQINQVHMYHTTIKDELNRIAAEQEDAGSKIVDIDLFKGLVLKDWTTKGLLGHMWLHRRWCYLILNLLFLWIFGNAVCAKVGNIAYPLIYLVLGVAAGILHLAFSGHPAIEASGAINGVVGMYLVLFLTNSISCVFWPVVPAAYFKLFEVPSYAMIMLWFVYDGLVTLIEGGHIAYFAHIGGFMSGFVIAAILVQIKFIKMRPYEKSLFQIFSDVRYKPQPKEPLFKRILEREFSVGNENPTAEKIPVDNAKQIQQPVLPTDIFSKKPAGQVESSSTQSIAGINDGFIRFNCNCGKRCKIPAVYAGKTGKCPKCKQLIKIPEI